MLASNDPRTTEIGSHFLSELGAARQALTGDEEAKLAALAMSHLAEPDRPPAKPSDP